MSATTLEFRTTFATLAAEERPGTARLPLLAEPQIRILARIPASERDAYKIPPAARDAIRACCRGDSPWPLLLHGGCGTGKTSAALALADRTRGRAFFRDFGALCNELADAKMGRLFWYGTNAETQVRPDYYWADWRRAALCIVDELGSRDKISDHTFETAKRCIDERRGRALLLTSNLDLDALARLFDDRVASRIAGGTVVCIDGADRRFCESA